MKSIIFSTISLVCVSIEAHGRQDCAVLNERDRETCVAENYKEADQELNRVYQSFLKSTSEQESLKKAQRAWVQFRDAECSYVASWETLTQNGPYINRYTCLEALTLYRVKALQHLQNNYEGRSQGYEAF